MKFIGLVLALLGAASAGLLPPTLVPKVNIAAPQVTVVKQPVHVTQTEYVYRSVPEPVRAIAYTAPVIAPAPAIVASPAFAAHSYAAAPALLSHTVW